MGNKLVYEKGRAFSARAADGCATKRALTALIVLKQPEADVILGCRVADRGFTVTVETDPERALTLCRHNAPDLVVVGDLLPMMSGSRFIAELLKISWTSATILVTDKDEASVHEQTEGLGILGHMRRLDDTDSLDILLEKFMHMEGQ